MRMLTHKRLQITSSIMTNSTGAEEATQKRTFKGDRLLLVEREEKTSTPPVGRGRERPEGAALRAPKIFWERGGNLHYFRHKTCLQPQPSHLALWPLFIPRT